MHLIYFLSILAITTSIQFCDYRSVYRIVTCNNDLDMPSNQALETARTLVLGINVTFFPNFTTKMVTLRDVIFRCKTPCCEIPDPGELTFSIEKCIGNVFFFRVRLI